MKLSGFKVDVTHDKVAASVILREFKQMGHELRTLQKSIWKTLVFYRMAILMWAFDVDADGEEATSNELMLMTRERQAERADQEGRRCEDGSP